MDKWVCITVNTTYHRGDKHAVTLAIERIFGKDLKEVLFVCDEVMWQSGEYYCFIRCPNYAAHIPLLKENSLFFQVVPNCEAPSWLTKADVDKFIESVQSANKRTDYVKGDIVNIKEGYLKNLCGIVMGKHKKKYKVSFHFCTRRLIENLAEGHLQFMGNLFRNRKFPVTKESIAGGHIPSKYADPELQEALQLVSHHQIHRKTNRGRGKTG